MLTEVAKVLYRWSWVPAFAGTTPRVLVAAVRAALVPVGHRIGRQPGLRRQRGVAKILGAASRAIAVAERRFVVPPAALVVGGAEKDLVMDAGVLQADADELHQVLGLDPDRQPPLVDRRIGDVADADAGDAQPIFEGVERAQRLAERLAHAVARVRPHRRVRPDAAAARIEADGVVGRGEDDALDAVPARRLEQVVAADDVGVEDRLPWPLDREAAE